MYDTPASNTIVDKNLQMYIFHKFQSRNSILLSLWMLGIHIFMKYIFQIYKVKLDNYIGISDQLIWGMTPADSVFWDLI